MQGGGLFLITDQWAAANPTKVADAVAALWESQQWVRQNPKEAAAIEAEFLKVEPRIVEVTFKWLNYHPLIDDFTRQSLQTTAKYLAAEKLIPVEVKPEQHLVEFEQVVARGQGQACEAARLSRRHDRHPRRQRTSRRPTSTPSPRMTWWR